MLRGLCNIRDREGEAVDIIMPPLPFDACGNCMNKQARGTSPSTAKSRIAHTLARERKGVTHDGMNEYMQ